MRNKYVALFLFILVSQTAGILGAFFTTSAIPTWYTTLNKPFFNPPNWIFGPVWTVLYLLMGISAYLVWKEGFGKTKVKAALNAFFVQLILNSLWSIIFFGLKNPLLAFLEIIVLWYLILKTYLAFNKLSKTAGYLLLPYLAWVSFASILNLSIVILN
jgi:benzodiazapine receptor